MTAILQYGFCMLCFHQLYIPVAVWNGSFQLYCLIFFLLLQNNLRKQKVCSFCKAGYEIGKTILNCFFYFPYKSLPHLFGQSFGYVTMTGYTTNFHDFHLIAKLKLSYF